MVQTVVLVIFTVRWFLGSMTLDEMREHLQMSKPSMSAGVKNCKNTISLSNNLPVAVGNNIL